MPQMMPLNWILLALFFTIIFYLFNNMNFYSFFYLSKKINFKIMPNKLNWKW
uniref:ATP synthase complex subunit 8 n=1 Tax=Psylliodes gougeleti TaxID=467380 RepID=A0A3G1GNC0_9CUCU|nr:ATP synthase F0 subunit 8 [Psylliodes gougeleti]